MRKLFINGRRQLLLFYYIGGASCPYPSRNEMVDKFPGLDNKFLYYRNYAIAPLNTILTPEQPEGFLELKAKQLRNCWLKNTGGKLVPMKSRFLPGIRLYRIL